MSNVEAQTAKNDEAEPARPATASADTKPADAPEAAPSAAEASTSKVETAQERFAREGEAAAKEAAKKQAEEDVKALRLSEKPLLTFKKKAAEKDTDLVIHAASGKTYVVRSDGTLRDEPTTKVLGAACRIAERKELQGGVTLRPGEVVKGLRLAIQRGEARPVFSGPIDRVEEVKPSAPES